MIERLRALISAPESLASRAISAGLWRLGGHGAGLVLRLGGNLVMTRLLAPEAFGLMAMVTALHIGLVMFSDIGIKSCVVRSDHGGEPAFLRTAWTMQLAQFAALSVALVALAAILSWSQGVFDFGETVYGDDRLPGLLAFSSIALLAQGARSGNIALADRKLLQARVILVGLASQSVTIASMLAFAYFQPAVWALVFGTICGSIVSAVASHLFIPGPRMGLELNRAHMREIWTFGRWLVGASILGFFANQGDRLILSAFLSKDEFGLYAIAILWVGALQVGLRRAMSPSMAALSEVRRGRKERLAGAFRKLRTVQDILSFGAGVPLIVFGDAIMRLLYTPEFAEAGSFVSVLAFIIIFSRYQPFGALLLAVGDSKRIAATTLATSIAMLTITPALFIWFGPFWAALGIGLNRVWATPILFDGVRSHVRLRWTWEIAQIALILAVAGFWAASIAT